MALFSFPLLAIVKLHLFFMLAAMAPIGHPQSKVTIKHILWGSATVIKDLVQVVMGIGVKVDLFDLLLNDTIPL